MKKIMFNDKYDLTQAVLSGCKTMTRRLITQPPYENFDISFPLPDVAFNDKHPLCGAFCWVNKDNEDGGQRYGYLYHKRLIAIGTMTKADAMTQRHQHQHKGGTKEQYLLRFFLQANPYIQGRQHTDQCADVDSLLVWNEERKQDSYQSWNKSQCQIEAQR